ncbi:unnamed protein product [Cuscuta campestris]|uniref:Reverse transcriptase Ty1/copia-type domain-containing protein n=1 Tax=Cuscuta campestris TaxID=132261 RepID=A0A484KKZ1_9ASTE|nr:unnamed protein product [Cuscuta campestris]
MAKSEITSQSTSQKPPHLAFSVSNVKLHVPIQLSFSQPNYKKWSRLFLLLTSRFNLHGYLDGSIAPISDDDDEWFQLDAILQGWILSTITDEVSDLVISSVSTASALWEMIHDLFHDNKHARAMQLEHQFRTTVKGSTPMATYCQELRNIADWLDDVDAPVSEHQLILQMLRGLPDDLQAQTSFLQFQDPMSSFLQVRSALLLLDRQRTPLGSTSSTALLAGHGGSGYTGGQHSGNGGRGSGSDFGSGGHFFGSNSGDGSSSGQRGGFGRGQGHGNGNRGRALLQSIIQQLKAEFAMTDMGDLHFFLGINVHRTASGLFLHQTQFAHDILERAGMISCRPISTPVDTKAKLSASAGTALSDPSLYRSIVGFLDGLSYHN